ncbi:MAG: hypothetical protein KIT31_07210 [Deltaproteobacteria bacterium]|nr:hypothetical protein [Deltaproteobacteria bacterium]
MFPLVAEDAAEVTAAICELAEALDAGAGSVAVEPTYPQARELALGGFVPSRASACSSVEVETATRGAVSSCSGRAPPREARPRDDPRVGRLRTRRPHLAAPGVPPGHGPENDGRDGFEQPLASPLAPILMDLSDVTLA